MTNQVPAVDITLIQSLNQRAKQSNSDRSRLLGQKEVAQRQFDQGVAAYKAKYGVDLSTVSIEAEYAAEVERVNSEAQALQQQLADIESGAYKTKLPAGVAPTHPAQAQPQAQPQAQSPGTTIVGEVTGEQAKQFMEASSAGASGAVGTTPASQTPPPTQPQAQPQSQPQQAPPPAPEQPAQGKPSWMTGAGAVTGAGAGAETPQPDQGRPSWMTGAASVPNAQPNSQPNAQPDAQDQDVSEKPFTPPAWGAPMNTGNAEVESTFGQMFGNQPNNGNGTNFGG